MVTAVRKAGYKAACTTKTGKALASNDPLRMHRIPIINTDDISIFSRKIALASCDVGWSTIARYYRTKLFGKLLRKRENNG